MFSHLSAIALVFNTPSLTRTSLFFVADKVSTLWGWRGGGTDYRMYTPHIHSTPQTRIICTSLCATRRLVSVCTTRASCKAITTSDIVGRAAPSPQPQNSTAAYDDDNNNTNSSRTNISNRDSHERLAQLAGA